jgi:hypothetical protein
MGSDNRLKSIVEREQETENGRYRIGYRHLGERTRDRELGRENCG